MIPEGYNYTKHLDEHCSGWRTFQHRPVYPRQIHFYLPSGQDEPCNFHCYYCCGLLGTKAQVSWEDTGLELIENLGGAVPFHMYSGAYVETTLNPRLVEFINATKATGCCYGLKTNGSMLAEMEDEVGLISTLIETANSEKDFVSISLDAGFASSHSKTKGVPEDVFYDIECGLQELAFCRKNRSYPKIRISYLLNEYNDSTAEILAAVAIARRHNVDSIRFAQLHPVYGASEKSARDVMDRNREGNERYRKLFDAYETRWSTEKPVVFFVPTEPCPVFNQCVYGYYQITLSSDGYVYRCTTAADEIFKELRLGKITSDLKEFDDMLYDNQDPEFNPAICYKLGAYCCRCAVAINSRV